MWNYISSSFSLLFSSSSSSSEHSPLHSCPQEHSSSSCQSNSIILSHSGHLTSRLNPFVKSSTISVLQYGHNISKSHSGETYNSFSKIQHSLPSNFVRCHKSYIVNINNILDIQSNNMIHFKNHTYCEIGPKYKENLLEVIKNYGNHSNNLDSFI